MTALLEFLVFGPQLKKIQEEETRHDLEGYMSLVVCAFYFSLLLSAQSYPLMVGPYETWEECTKVREWLDWRTYETDNCEPFPYPQGGSQLLVVPYLPKETSLAASRTDSELPQ
ncbi:MAG TPA: hypothetical protein VJQ25_08660 [Nitrospira sp.]|nr:hypothetical protein [Nitrospira sp.]